MPKNFLPNEYYPVDNYGDNAFRAAVLSIVPGLGQFYNGQRVKGFLFIDVAAINFAMVWVMAFAKPMCDGIKQILTSNHMRANDGILSAIASTQLGAPFSLITISLFTLFVGYAVRDAYDNANGKKRRALYADRALNISEAASGSYLLHLAAMICLAILALVFLVPRPANVQTTVIEFADNTIESRIKPKEDTKVRAQKSAATSVKKERDEVAHQSSSSARSTSSSSSASRPAPAKTQPAKQAPSPVVSKPIPTPIPTPVKPILPTFRPTPITPAPAQMNKVAMLPTTAPTPMPRANSTPAGAISIPTPTAVAGITGVSAPQVQAFAASGIKSGTTPSPATSIAGQGSPSKAIGSGVPQPVSASSRNTEPGSSTNPVPVAASGLRPNSSGRESGEAPTPSKRSSHPGTEGNGATPMAQVVVPNSGGSTHPTADAKGAGDVSPPTDVDFTEYMAELQRRIKRNWVPPKINYSKQVILIFQVHPDGELGSLRLSKSSGVALVDDAAMQAVRASAPFRHLPSGAKETVDIQFTFDYHIFNGGSNSLRY